MLKRLAARLGSDRDPLRFWVLAYPFAAAAFIAALDWQYLAPMVLAAGFFIWGVVNAVRWHRHSAEATARRALVALVASRTGTWLNRDEHLLFHISRNGLPWARRWQIVRLDEDQTNGFEDFEPGSSTAPMTGEAFLCYPGRIAVHHHTFGAKAVIEIPEDDDADAVITVTLADDAGSWLARKRRAARKWRHLRGSRAALLHASLEEISALAGQIQGAEPFTEPGQ